MQQHIDNKAYHVEILTPKLDAPDIEAELAKFAEKYRAVIAAGYVVCITDNPMGHMSVTAMEAIEAGKVTETVHLVNWKEPGKNDFAIAEEVTLRGNHERRPDLVLYVNGIAVGVLENVIPGYVDPLVGGGTRDLVAATVILLTILVRPFGLFGREDIERV